MKEQELRLTLTFGVEDCEDLEEAKTQLEIRLNRENRIAENEFWDNLELVEVLE